MKDMELSGILKLWFVFWTASAQDTREECATFFEPGVDMMTASGAREVRRVVNAYEVILEHPHATPLLSGRNEWCNLF